MTPELVEAESMHSKQKEDHMQTEEWMQRTLLSSCPYFLILLKRKYAKRFEIWAGDSNKKGLVHRLNIIQNHDGNIVIISSAEGQDEIGILERMFRSCVVAD